MTSQSELSLAEHPRKVSGEGGGREEEGGRREEGGGSKRGVAAGSLFRLQSESV